MSLEREQSIVELKTILDRNDTQSPEELRMQNEPQGDWQSPSDNERWQRYNQRYNELVKKRLKTHIDNSKNKLGEEQFLKDMIDVTLPAIIRRKTEEKKQESSSKKFYTRLTGSDNTTKINNAKIDGEIQDLKALIPRAQNQLKYYDLFITPKDRQYEARKEYLALSESMPSDARNAEIAPNNPQIPKYLFNPEAQKEIMEMMGPTKGGKRRKSKKSRKSKTSKTSKKSKKSRKSRKN